MAGTIIIDPIATLTDGGNVAVSGTITVVPSISFTIDSSAAVPVPTPTLSGEWTGTLAVPASSGTHTFVVTDATTGETASDPIVVSIPTGGTGGTGGTGDTGGTGIGGTGTTTPPPPPIIIPTVALSGVGGTADMAARIKSVLPTGWFPAPAAESVDIPGGAIGTFVIGQSATGDDLISTPSDSPVLDAVVSGMGQAYALAYSLLRYADNQSRLETASGVMLDVIGLDFLGLSLTRRNGQNDDSWRTLIQQEILEPKVTRPAMVERLTNLTGHAPTIFEPAMPMDTGGLNVGTFALGVAGGLGNLSLPFQCFITARRPTGGGVASVAGLGSSYMGLGSGYCIVVDHSAIGGQVTDADIFAAVAACQADSTIPWTAITG